MNRASTVPSVSQLSGPANLELSVLRLAESIPLEGGNHGPDVHARRVLPQILRRLVIAGDQRFSDPRGVAVRRDALRHLGQFQVFVDQPLDHLPSVSDPRDLLHVAVLRRTASARVLSVRPPEP